LNTVITVYLIVVTTLLGVIIGSFLNVIIYRIPAGRTVTKGRSMCMTCGHTLAAKDLVPIFSWLFLKGKCRYCGAPVASRYCKIESFTGLVFLITAIISKDYVFPIAFMPDSHAYRFYAIYFLLFLASMAVIIAAMMIFYDTGKCFTGFAITAVCLKLVSTALALPFGIIEGYTFSALGEDILLALGKCALTVGLSGICSLIVRKEYTKADLNLDICLSLTPLYGLYFGWGPEVARALMTAAVYAAIMTFLRAGKLKKYCGIVAVVTYLVYMVIRYIFLYYIL